MKTKRLIAMLLAMSMLLTLLAGCGKKNDEKPENTPEPTQRPQYELTDAAVNKEETVYVNVSPDGEVKKISVTDRLHTDMPQVRIEDKSNLSGIQDVKTFSEPVKDNDKLARAAEKLGEEDVLRRKYATADNAIVFAMGDGNHSLAAAKLHWEEVKKTLPEAERESAPARYALAELVNIHDASISFEPIHKVIFDTDPVDFFAEAKAFFTENEGEGRSIDLVTGEGIERFNISGLTIGQLIGRCEDFCKAYTERHGGYIDYIHGDCECVEMAQLRLRGHTSAAHGKVGAVRLGHEKRTVSEKKLFHRPRQR